MRKTSLIGPIKPKYKTNSEIISLITPSTERNERDSMKPKSKKVFSTACDFQNGYLEQIQRVSGQFKRLGPFGVYINTVFTCLPLPRCISEDGDEAFVNEL